MGSVHSILASMATGWGKGGLSLSCGGFAADLGVWMEILIIFSGMVCAALSFRVLNMFWVKERLVQSNSIVLC